MADVANKNAEAQLTLNLRHIIILFFKNKYVPYNTGEILTHKIEFHLKFNFNWTSYVLSGTPSQMATGQLYVSHE